MALLLIQNDQLDANGNVEKTYDIKVKKVLSLSIPLLMSINGVYASSGEGRIQTYKNTYPVFFEVIQKRFETEKNIKFGNSSKFGLIVLEKENRVASYVALPGGGYLKISTHLADTIQILKDMAGNPGFTMMAGKTVFSYHYNVKMCKKAEYINLNEKNIFKKGFKELKFDEVELANNQYSKSFFKNKTSLNLSIWKDKEVCHREIFYVSEN